MEQFLPIIKNETDKKRLNATYYPYLFDRIKMLQNKPQEFGTQDVFDKKSSSIKPYKMLQIDIINENRKKFGLYPLK